MKHFDLFIDVWKSNDYGVKHIRSADLTQTNFDIDVEEDGEFIIRLQPELLSSGNYILSISMGPALASPVAGNKGRIASVWGDSRDGEARSHEGVDLFAPFKTPAVAAADGIITRVNENRLGGKVVWLRPSGKNLSLYYAHLEKQLVNEGDRIKEGDTIGLIGNTGNARSTPPHLHFGIYASGGAIDPFPFINQNRKNPPELLSEDYNKLLRTKRGILLKEKGQSIEVKKYTPVWLLAYSKNEIRIQTPSGKIATVPAGAIENATPIKKIVSSKTSYLFSSPVINSLEIAVISPWDTFQVYGYNSNYAFIGLNSDTKGWIPIADL